MEIGVLKIFQMTINLIYLKKKKEFYKLVEKLKELEIQFKGIWDLIEFGINPC